MRPRLRTAAALALLAISIATGCGSSANTTTLDVTVQTDPALLAMLDNITLTATAAGRGDAGTHFTALAPSLQWTVRIANAPSPFTAIVTATGSEIGGLTSSRPRLSRS